MFCSTTFFTFHTNSISFAISMSSFINLITPSKSDIFYAVKVREIDCLGNITIYKNKTVQKIYLDSTKIVYEKVFQIKGIFNRHIVVDLEVMEKLLRENIIAFYAERLEQERSEMIWEKICCRWSNTKLLFRSLQNKIDGTSSQTYLYDREKNGE